jgi:hypothetical protein
MAETSLLTRATRRHITEDGILLSHRCENLKSYNVIFVSKHCGLQSRGEVPYILNTVTGWKSVFRSLSGSFDPRRVPTCPLYRRPGIAQRHSEVKGELKSQGLVLLPFGERLRHLWMSYISDYNEISEKGNRNVWWVPMDSEQPIIICSFYQISFWIS